MPHLHSQLSQVLFTLLPAVSNAIDRQQHDFPLNLYVSSWNRFQNERLLAATTKEWLAVVFKLVVVPIEIVVCRGGRYTGRDRTRNNGCLFCLENLLTCVHLLTSAENCVGPKVRKSLLSSSSIAHFCFLRQLHELPAERETEHAIIHTRWSQLDLEGFGRGGMTRLN